MYAETIIGTNTNTLAPAVYGLIITNPPSPNSVGVFFDNPPVFPAVRPHRRKDFPAVLPNLHEKELIIMGFTALCFLGLLFFVAWATDDWQ